MRIYLAFLLLVGVALLTPLAAQQPGNPSSQPPFSAPQSARRNAGSRTEEAATLKATTRMVIVDVIARDNQNEPVTALKRDDFGILEQGREERVRVFEFVQPEPSSAPPVVKHSPNTFSNTELPPPRTLNVLLLDALNTTWDNTAYARHQALKYLENVPADQPLAVFLLAGDLYLLKGFTDDPAVLKEALKSFHLQHLPPAMQKALQELAGVRPAFVTNNRAQITSLALQRIARILAGYSGRKNLIWLADSFPLGSFPDSSLGIPAYRAELSKTADVLIGSRVAVYPVDAAGVLGGGLGAGSSGYDESGSKLFGPAYGTTLERQLAPGSSTHLAMEQLARRTGGKAFYSRNDLDTAIDSSIADGSTYYTLGYYPADKNWNGEFRAIKVKVKRPGIELRHRPGYFATDSLGAATDSASREQDIADALNLSNLPSTALLFSAAPGAPSAAIPGRLMLKFAVDAHFIDFKPGEDGLQHAEVACYLRAFSQEGTPLKGTSQTITAALKPGTYQQVMKTGFPCSAELDLPPGTYLLRLAVRDEHTGLIGTANGNVTIPPAVPHTAAQKGR